MAQYEWFVKALAAAPKDDWLFVVAHHPAEEMDFAGMQRSPVRPDPAELPWPIFRVKCGFGTNFRISLFLLSFVAEISEGTPSDVGSSLVVLRRARVLLNPSGSCRKFSPFKKKKGSRTRARSHQCSFGLK